MSLDKFECPKCNTNFFSYGAQEVLNLIKDQIEFMGSQKAYAKYCGISAQYLNDIIRGRRNISPKILKKLSLKKKITYYLDV